MTLKTNNFRDSLGATRFFGATASNGAYPAVERFNYNLIGARRNLYAGQADINDLSAVPAGARPPVSIMMAQKAGGMASRNASIIEFDSVANAVLGLPAVGSATITLDATGTGALVVSGSGSASIDFTATGTILSIASGSGIANVTFTATAAIGAEAGIQGQASITLSATGDIKAIGYMSGTSTSETEFSAAALAQAVWTASSTTYNDSGTMGELLNNAGGGASPETIAAEVWGTVIESGLDATEVLRVLTSVLAGDATGLEGNVQTFRDLSNTKNRVSSTYQNGRRTITSIDGT